VELMGLGIFIALAAGIVLFVGSAVSKMQK
jgi:hypothetical protein